jgi:hypothetical protein
MTHEEYNEMKKHYKRGNVMLAIVSVLAICVVGFLVYKLGKHV